MHPFIASIFCLCLTLVASIPLYLAPYGPAFGDQEFNGGPDGNVQLTLPQPIKFGTRTHSVAYVRNLINLLLL